MLLAIGLCGSSRWIGLCVVWPGVLLLLLAMLVGADQVVVLVLAICRHVGLLCLLLWGCSTKRKLLFVWMVLLLLAVGLCGCSRHGLGCIRVMVVLSCWLAGSSTEHKLLVVLAEVGWRSKHLGWPGRWCDLLLSWLLLLAAPNT